jgi:hypothetical protein
MALLAAALGILCALVVAACGSSSSASPPTSSTTTTGTSTTSASFAAFRNCLTQHGASLPQGGGFGGGGGGGGQSGAGGGNRPAPSPALQKALTACASLRPAGGFGRGARAGGAGNSNNPAFAKFQACLKAHGATTGSTSQKNAAAIAACRSVLPNGGNGNPAGSATITPTTTTG